MSSNFQLNNFFLENILKCQILSKFIIYKKFCLYWIGFKICNEQKHACKKITSESIFIRLATDSKQDMPVFCVGKKFVNF